MARLERHHADSSNQHLIADELKLSSVLSQMASFLVRNRGLLAGFVIGSVLLCAILALTTEKRYRTTLLLMADPPLQSPLETTEQTKRDEASFVESQIYILESRDILQAVLEAADLEATREYSQSEPSLISRAIGAVKSLLPTSAGESGDEGGQPVESHALRELRKNIGASRKGDTNVIGIDVTSTSARRAAQIANAMGDAFIANRQAAQLERAERLAQWLDGRVVSLRQQLSGAEDAVTSYRIEHKLISGDPGTTLSEQQLFEMNAELIRTRAVLAEKRAAYERAMQLLEDGGDIQSLPQVQDSDLITLVREKLIQIKLREAELARMNATDPRREAIANERRAVEAELAAEIGRTVRMIGHEVETLEAREALVAAALAEAGNRSGVENRSIVELRELERVAQAYQALYERYLGSTGLVDETISYLSSGVEIVEPAAVPRNPSYPPTKLLLIWGLLLGVALGVVAGLLREALRPGFLSSAQAEADLGVPVLGAVPGAGASRPEIDAAIRSLRMRLGLTARRDGPLRLLLTSARDGDGKDGLAEALARSAAAAGASVLLIDADWTHVGLTARLGLQAKTGLADALRGASDAECQHPLTGCPGATVLPLGKWDSAVSDDVAGAAMQSLLARVSAAHDLVIVIAPSVPGDADAPLLARFCDGVAVVARWAVTPRAAVAMALDQFKGVAQPGLVLSDMNRRQARHFGEPVSRHAPG